MRCPDPPKGQTCPVCGGNYVCLRSELPKGKPVPVIKGKTPPPKPRSK